MLKGRQQPVMLRQAAYGWREVMREVVQGSVSGPVQCSIFHNDVETKLRSHQ